MLATVLTHRAVAAEDPVRQRELLRSRVRIRSLPDVVIDIDDLFELKTRRTTK